MVWLVAALPRLTARQKAKWMLETWNRCTLLFVCLFFLCKHNWPCVIVIIIWVSLAISIFIVICLIHSEKEKKIDQIQRFFFKLT
jgi:4-hydroxybenzoate polyprenyltransferase